MAAYEAVCLVGDKKAEQTSQEGASDVVHNAEADSPNNQCVRALMFGCVPDAGSNVDVVCATPAVLLHDEYSALFRGWTLVKGKPERERDGAGVEKWKFHLLGKSAIFGTVSASESSIAAEGDGVGRFGKVVKGVRMHGPDGRWDAWH